MKPLTLVPIEQDNNNELQAFLVFTVTGKQRLAGVVHAENLLQAADIASKKYIGYYFVEPAIQQNVRRSERQEHTFTFN